MSMSRMEVCVQNMGKLYYRKYQKNYSKSLAVGFLSVIFNR